MEEQIYARKGRMKRKRAMLYAQPQPDTLASPLPGNNVGKIIAFVQVAGESKKFSLAEPR